jgi:hypothetical protein
MSVYVVKRDLPGITPERLVGAGARAKTCAAEMTEEGTPVRWIRSFFIPETEQTHCYFEAPSADAVREVNERANVPFKSVHEVQEMTPDSV